MDKALARAKHSSSRRGRRRLPRSHYSGPGPGARSSDANWSSNDWRGFEDVLPLEEIKEGEGKKSQGLDYAELLAQDPLIGFEGPGVYSRGLDPFEDALADIYSTDDPEPSTAAEFLSLDLDILGKRLSKMSFKSRLLVDDDETLPPELDLLPEADEASTSSDSSFKVDEVDDTVEPNDFRVDTEDPKSEGVDAVTVQQWLNTAVQDPDSGKALPFDITDTKTGANKEAELDALLDLLDNVAIRQDEDIGTLGKVSGSGLDIQLGGDQGITSRRDVETTLWSPREDLTTPLSGTAPPPPLEEDFDAWLDSLS